MTKSLVIEPAHSMDAGLGLSQHKAKLQRYFNGVGFQRWSAIYGGHAALSHVRRNIRDGHAAMLAQAESWLREHHWSPIPHVLDAGCGTGLFSVALAKCGFFVTGIDLAPQMIEAAALHASDAGLHTQTRFHAGDLESLAADERFDAVACFDVLIHYPAPAFAQMLTALARRTRGPLLFTYAPSTPLLSALHWIGGRFPASDRRTAIEIVPPQFVAHTLRECGMRIHRNAHIHRGFYNVTLVEAHVDVTGF